MKIDEQWEFWTLCATKNKGTYRGREGTTPVTTACPEDAEGKTSYELGWKVKVIIKNIYIEYKQYPEYKPLKYSEYSEYREYWTQEYFIIRVKYSE